MAKRQALLSPFATCCFVEFGVSKVGIPRYKDQPGLETDPIVFNSQWIGFQSKFFDKNNKQDIEDSVAITKRQYPHVNKIYVYLNLEFSKSSKDG